MAQISTAAASRRVVHGAMAQGSIFGNFPAHADGERRGLDGIGKVLVRRAFRYDQDGHGSSAFAVGKLRNVAKKKQDRAQDRAVWPLPVGSSHPEVRHFF